MDRTVDWSMQPGRNCKIKQDNRNSKIINNADSEEFNSYRGVLIIEPIRLPVKNNGQFISHQIPKNNEVLVKEFMNE